MRHSSRAELDEPNTGSQPGEAVLLVSPFEEDRAFLRTVLQSARCRTCQARTCREASALLNTERLAVVICERNLPDGEWKDMLDKLAPLPVPPCLIVTSRAADEWLWAEVLNLGGYDVLAKPFDAEEVSRVVTLASRSWERVRTLPPPMPLTAPAPAGQP